MAKQKNNDLMATLAAMFCFFVVFLQCVSLLSAFSFGGLLLPSLWLIWGVFLLTKRKNWLCTIGFLPLMILSVRGAWAPLPTGSVEAFLQALLCSVLPAAGFAIMWLMLLLTGFQTATKLHRKLWLVPILLVLPGCVWQSANTLPWAQFGMIACTCVWLKPSGKNDRIYTIFIGNTCKTLQDML